MAGWGRRTLTVTPSGKVLPCHAAETIPGLEFWNVRDHSLAEIWAASPAFLAYRGTEWMVEPCRSCARRDIDFGGCRCQALAMTGDARNADPVCHLSPHHGTITPFLGEHGGAAGGGRGVPQTHCAGGQAAVWLVEGGDAGWGRGGALGSVFGACRALREPAPTARSASPRRRKGEPHPLHPTP